MLNLVPLYTTVFKNIVSVNFGGEFNSRVIKIYLPWFTYVPQRKNVIRVAFPNSWLEDGFAYLIHASRQGKLLLSQFVPIVRGTVSLYEDLSIELERIFFED